MTVEYAKEKTARGEKEWNKICGSALHLLVKMELIPTEDIIVLLVEHLIDYTNYTEIIDILNYFNNKVLWKLWFEFHIFLQYYNSTFLPQLPKETRRV